MNALIQLNRQLRYLFITLLLASFAVVQSAQAIGPEPSEDDLIGNMAEEDDAVLDLSAETGNAAMGQPNQTPNHRLIRIDFRKSISCAEVVKVSSQWHVHFKKISEGAVEVESANLKQFSGKGETTGRKYMAGKAFFPEKSVTIKNGIKEGKFVLEFVVIGPPNPAGKPDPNPRRTFRFKVQQTVRYKFAMGKVKSLDKGAIDIDCRN